MGIPDFFGTYIKEKSQSALNNEPLTNVSSFAIDANAIVYNVLPYVIRSFVGSNTSLCKYINKRDFQTSLIETTSRVISGIICAAKPIDCAIIAFDGPAPIAKIQNQKSKRYATAANREPTDVDYNGEPFFDTNCITPGTEFMRELDVSVRSYLDAIMEISGVKKVIYSSHMVEGEGEHKIFEYYRSGKVKSKGNGIHVIYSVDADINLISLLSPMKNIVIARDSISLDIVYSKIRVTLNRDNKGTNIYIEKLKEVLRERMGYANINYLEDFCIIVNLVGNDFIHRSISIPDVSWFIDECIAICDKEGIRLTDEDKEIDWKGMEALFKKLSQNEEKYLNMIYNKEKNSKPTKYKNLKKITAFQNAEDKGKISHSLFRDNWYTMVIETITEKKLKSNQKDLLLAVLCYNYLKGVAWTYKYYTKGQNEVTWLWYYPYDLSPLFKDVYHALYGMDQLEEMGRNNTKALMNVDPLENEFRPTALHQLICVIPPQSYRIIPKYVRHLYSSDSPLYDIMYSPIKVIEDGKDQEWKYVNVVRKADYKTICKLLDTFTRFIDWNYWKPEFDKVISFDKRKEDNTSVFVIKSSIKFTNSTYGLENKTIKRGLYRKRGEGKIDPNEIKISMEEIM